MTSYFYLVVCVILFAALHFQTLKIVSIGYLIYLIKFILEIYFLILNLKICQYSSVSYKIQEYVKKVWSYVTIYIFCIDEETYQQQQQNDYQDFDELDSDY